MVASHQNDRLFIRERSHRRPVGYPRNGAFSVSSGATRVGSKQREKTKVSYNKMLSTIAAVAAMGCAAGSHAAPAPRQVYGSEYVSVRVRLADLDLASPAGAEAGLRRIHNAAREVCGPDSDSEFFEMRRIHEACMDDVVSRAVDRLGNPVVSALNGGRRSAVMASNGH